VRGTAPSGHSRPPRWSDTAQRISEELLIPRCAFDSPNYQQRKRIKQAKKIMRRQQFQTVEPLPCRTMRIRVLLEKRGTLPAIGASNCDRHRCRKPAPFKIPEWEIRYLPQLPLRSTTTLASPLRLATTGATKMCTTKKSEGGVFPGPVHSHVSPCPLGSLGSRESFSPSFAFLFRDFGFRGNAPSSSTLNPAMELPPPAARRRDWRAPN